jgi:hypothetical protein
MMYTGKYIKISLTQLRKEQKGKMEENGKLLWGGNQWPSKAPHLGYSLSIWACLSSVYTKLDLLSRSKYCCSKSNNLGTKFAGHSYMKSSKGRLLHTSVRLERGTNSSSNQRTWFSQRPKWSLETVCLIWNA